MTLRLDPRRPIVWRTPHSLQIGVDPVLAHLDDVSDGDARLIDALVVGVTRGGLAMLAEHAGVPAYRVETLLAGVAPALVAADARGPGGPAARPTIAVVGSGLGAQRVAGVLHEAGHPVALRARGAAEPGARVRRADVAVLVSAHVVDPLEHLRWLRADVPHLPIVFGEAAVTIGPVVGPGATACLGCVERRRAVDDAARTAIASQLWGAPADAESPALATEAAVEAVRMLRAGIPNPAAGPAVSVSLRLDAESGARETTEWWPSDDCGCLELTLRSAPESRRGTGSAPARRAPRSTAAPTTVRALVAPG